MKNHNNIDLEKALSPHIHVLPNEDLEGLRQGAADVDTVLNKIKINDPEILETLKGLNEQERGDILKLLAREETERRLRESEKNKASSIPALNPKAVLHQLKLLPPAEGASLINTIGKDMSHSKAADILLDLMAIAPEKGQKMFGVLQRDLQVSLVNGAVTMDKTAILESINPKDLARLIREQFKHDLSFYEKTEITDHTCVSAVYIISSVFKREDAIEVLSHLGTSFLNKVANNKYQGGGDVFANEEAKKALKRYLKENMEEIEERSIELEEEEEKARIQRKIEEDKEKASVVPPKKQIDLTKPADLDNI